ncbi:MAG: hypothetical protein A2958_00035 [Candidatus Levybacteria bacterium RIFCSPLOWO2_01_FULL_38_13]|nr:MAG: hypothetical protein A2629_02120 [Candidatus Levybacteria bacterium RIFCSPHIGHO2_01_FULL_41_15]OGH34930.1 MAG: hypothetical protein A2958_00035 [Candidatus Levybacteria bacterium RIFCSPLOWO2_01_FULL_38_13]
MIQLSYTYSIILKEKLQQIESLRTEILLSPLSPKMELQLRWDAVVDKIFSSLDLAGFSVSRKQISKVLSHQTGNPKLLPIEEEIFNYKKALDIISRDWFVSSRSVSVKDTLILYDTFNKGRLILPLSRIQELLDYLQAHKENPIIQAGTACLGIERVRPFSEGNDQLGRFLAYLFLYKHGYDVRGLLVFEKNWSKDKTTYLDASRIGMNAASITLWLEFFANSVVSQLNETIGKIKSQNPDIIGLDSSFWDINERQKEILILLDQPNSTITNKKVQKYFKVSQITASRDLSKLSTLGLVFTHGRGRSVYYSKV